MDQAFRAREHRRLFAGQSAVLPIACVAGLLLVVFYVLQSGTWLDEYWQLWVSGAPRGLVVQRFGPDAHPPLFNLVGRAIIALTGSSVLAARLVNLALAVTSLALGLRSLDSLGPAVRWRIFLLAAASAGLVGMTHLASSFRVYPWVLVMATLQGALLLSVAEQRRVPAHLAFWVTLVSIALQYVHAAGALVIAIVSVGVAWRNGDRRAAAIFLFAAGAGASLDLATGLAQLPFWKAAYDVNWIGDSGSSPWQTIGEVFGNYLLFNLVGSGLIGLAAIRGKWRPLVVLVPLPIGLLVWLVMGSVQPLLVPRYLASIAGLLSVAAAAGWTELELGSPYDSLIAVLAALQPLFYTLVAPPRTGWEEGARIAASVTHRCVHSSVYAVPAWRFRDQPESRTARFETPVMGFAYQLVGRTFAVDPQVVTTPTKLHLNDCPAIIWMEAGHGIDRVPVEIVLKRSQLQVDGPFKAQYRPTQNGAVLLIWSANRLGRSR